MRAGACRLRARLPLAALGLLAGCAGPAEVAEMKCPTIPAPRAAPGPAPARPASDENLALAPGRWEWGVGSYNWMPPEWLPRPSHRYVKDAPELWKDGFWTPDGGACVWTAGRFVS